MAKNKNNPWREVKSMLSPVGTKVIIYSHVNDKNSYKFVVLSGSTRFEGITKSPESAVASGLLHAAA